jgi:phage tail-like protein
MSTTGAGGDSSGLEPAVSSRFLFEVDGVEIGVFAQVSGLELRVEVASYDEGGENGYTHQLPGRLTWPHIILRRGVTDTDALFSWVRKSAGNDFAANNNKLTRCTAAITILGPDNSRLRAWELQDAFAVHWTGPKFDVTSSDFLEEELEIAHHGFRSKTF